jgi:hypothetical protein
VHFVGGVEWREAGTKAFKEEVVVASRYGYG